MYLIKNLYDQHKEILRLELYEGQKGINRPIKTPEIQRPGLSLTGYLKNYSGNRILIFGTHEIEYLKDLDPKLRSPRLEALFTKYIPAVIIARNYRPPKELLDIAKKLCVPIFRSKLSTMNLLSKLTLILADALAPTIDYPGTFVDVFGIGVLIESQSNEFFQASEASLGLIERGHRLISDAQVKIKIKDGLCLGSAGNSLDRHLMDIRTIGMINPAHLYGTICVSLQKVIDLVLYLEEWDEEKHFYNHSELESKTISISGINIPFNTLYIKPGRNVVLLIETLVLNYRLKIMGYRSSKNYNSKTGF